MSRIPHLLATATAVVALQAAPLSTDLASELAEAAHLPELAVELDSAFAANAAFIRRSKLKQRQPIRPVKIIVYTVEPPDDDNPIASVDVGLPTVGDDGGSIPDQSLTRPNRHRKHFKGMLMQWPATYSITVTLGDGTAVTAPIDGLEPTVAGSETLVLLDGGFKAKVRIANDLQTKVVVFNEDKDWDPTMVTAVRVGDDETFLDVPLQHTVARWVKNIPLSDVPEGFGDGSSYVLDVTARDEAGNVVDQAIQGDVLGSTPSDDPILETARIRNKNGNVKVVTWTEGFNGKSNSVQTLVTDDEGTVLLSSLDDMPTRAARLYETRTLTFDDPSAAADEVYEVVVDLRDSTGATLGSGSVEVVVQGLIVLPDSIVDMTAATSLQASLSASATADTADTADATVDEEVNPDGVPFTVDVDGEAVSGVAAIVQLDATNFVLGVMVATDDAAWVDATILPISGPSPDPEVVTMAPVSEFKKYVSVGDAGIGTLDDGGTADLLQVLLNEEDEEEDIVFVHRTWAWYASTYKKRPRAPKGRLRSPKVNPSWDW